MGTLFLSLSILFNVVANAFFKSSSSIAELSSRKIIVLALGLLIGLANTVCYIKALETLKLGAAYAVFGAVSTILIAAVSAFFFQESISFQKAAGLIVICVGLLLLWSA